MTKDEALKLARQLAHLQPLSEDQIDSLWHDFGAGVEFERFVRLTRAIERAHAIDAALAEPISRQYIREQVAKDMQPLYAALAQPSQKDRAIQIVEWHRTGYNDQQIDQIVNALREGMK